MTHAAQELATQGAQRALSHANGVLFGWGDEALWWVERAAKAMEEFTTSYVRDLAMAAGFPEAPEPRAWGAVMQRARKQGIIHATDRFVCTNRLASHGRPERLWRRA